MSESWNHSTATTQLPTYSEMCNATSSKSVHSITCWYLCDLPVWTLGSPEVRRKQVASFLVLSRPREHRRDHFSLGDSGWVRLQPSSSERATFASPFCLESDRKRKTHRNVNAKAFTETPLRAQTKPDVYCIKSVFFCDKIQFNRDVMRSNLIPVCYCLYDCARFICQTNWKASRTTYKTRNRMAVYVIIWLKATLIFIMCVLKRMNAPIKCSN